MSIDLDKKKLKDLQIGLSVFFNEERLTKTSEHFSLQAKLDFDARNKKLFDARQELVKLFNQACQIEGGNYTTICIILGDSAFLVSKVEAARDLEILEIPFIGKAK